MKPTPKIVDGVMAGSMYELTALVVERDERIRALEAEVAALKVYLGKAVAERDALKAELREAPDAPDDEGETRGDGA